MSTDQIIFKKIFLFSGLVFVLDQLSKKLVFFYWPELLFCNSQMALGLPKTAWLFWPSYLFFFCFLSWLIFKNRSSLALFFVLGGAVSNLFDRFFLGCVADWLAFFNFPIFNLADVAIFLGLIWFFWQSRRELF